MSEQSESRVIVIGGGVGGLTTAIALGQAGIPVQVFERAANRRGIEVGGGFTMWPNSMRALAQLGLADQVAAAGAPFEVTQFVSARGRKLAVWPVGDWARKYGTISTFVNRSDLVRVLLDALPPDVVRFGAPCTGFVQDETGVTARFADGSEERGAVLIGADGMASPVRAQMFGPFEPQYVGYTMWSGYVPDPERSLAPSGLFSIGFGRGTKFMYHHVGDDQLHWQSVTNAQPGKDSDPSAVHAMIKERHRDWAAPTNTILDATSPTSIYRMDIFTRVPTREWGQGRATLIGDAAHPILFNMGQGAAQAMEDGIVVARHLDAHGLVPAALRAYELQRMDRAIGVQKRSYTLGRLGQIKHPVACWSRDNMMTIGFNTIGRRVQEKDTAFVL